MSVVADTSEDRLKNKRMLFFEQKSFSFDVVQEPQGFE